MIFEFNDDFLNLEGWKPPVLEKRLLVCGELDAFAGELVSEVSGFGKVAAFAVGEGGLVV